MDRLDAETVIRENEGLIWFHINRMKFLPTVVDRDDLYQAACVQILRYLDAYDSNRSQLSTYLSVLITTAIRREANTARWQRNRTQEYLRDDRQLNSLDENETEIESFDQEYDAEALELVGKIRSLPAKQRFIVLARQSGYTLEEVGDNLGITRERVRQIEKQVMNELSFLTALPLMNESLVGGRA